MKRQDFYTVKLNLDDVSVRVKDYTTPSVPMALTAGQYMHVGYYKAFRQFYIDFKVLNAVATSLVFEYYNGVTWVALPGVVDETEDFIKSGFMYWNRPGDWAPVEIDGDENYYIRISAPDDLTPETELNGVNVLFSNDIDLVGIRSNIVSKHNNDEPWIEKHEAARKHIIQQFRNLGHRKVKQANGDEPNVLFTGEKEDSLDFSDLTQFDLFDPFQLREASKFFALSYIYLDELSDENDDKWERAGLRHDKRADEALNVFMLRIDTNDDGEENEEENMGDTGTNLTWV